MYFMIIIIVLMVASTAHSSVQTHLKGKLKEIHTQIPDLFDDKDDVISLTDSKISYHRELRHPNSDSIYDPVRYRYTIKDSNMTVYTGGDWFYNLNEDAILRYSQIIKNDIKNK